MGLRKNKAILAWVDFGTLGWLDEHTWWQQFNLRRDIVFGLIHGAYEKLLDVLQPLPPADLSGFEMKVKTIIQDWVEASSSPNVTFQEKSSGYFFVRLFGAIRQQFANGFAFLRPGSPPSCDYYYSQSPLVEQREHLLSDEKQITLPISM